MPRVWRFNCREGRGREAASAEGGKEGGREGEKERRRTAQPRQCAYIVPGAASRAGGTAPAPPAPPSTPGEPRGAGGKARGWQERDGGTWLRCDESGRAMSAVEPGRSLPCLSFPRGRRYSVARGGHVLGVLGPGRQSELCSRGVPVLPQRNPHPRASVSPLSGRLPPTALPAGMPGQGGEGWRRGWGAPPGGRIRPRRGRLGHRKHPPPLFKPLPVVRRALGVRTCVWAGAGTYLKAPPGTQPAAGGGSRGEARAELQRDRAGGPRPDPVGRGWEGGGA